MTIQFPHMPEQITRSEAEIIDYISNNPREFLQDSIGAVSQKLGVSGTTLSRFARRVGCGDYKGLKRLVSQQEQPVGPAAKLLETQQGFTVENWMLRQQLCLEKTLEGLDPAFTLPPAVVLAQGALLATGAGLLLLRCGKARRA